MSFLMKLALGIVSGVLAGGAASLALQLAGQ